MFRACRPPCWGASVLLGLVLTAALPAEDIRPAAGDRARVNRLEINNGLTQTVRYFSRDLSPGEQANLRELERLENESLYVRNLQALKEQYVTDERFLEPYRRTVQRRLYGVNINTTSFGTLGPWGGYGYGGYGVGGYGYGYPWYGGYASYYPYGGYLGYPSYPVYGVGFLGNGLSTVNRSLANGMGNEGVMKTMIAGTIAQEATQQYADDINRAYVQATSRASSPAVRAVFGLAPGKGKATGVPLSGEERSSAVVLTLKSGDKVRGTRFTEDKDWFFVDVPTGQVRVRKSEVVQVETAGKPREHMEPAKPDDR